MSTPSTVYDSAQPRKPIITEFQNIWDHRGLIRLLVTRDLTVRYKRSVLGMWWTLLNPMLQVMVFWIVFSSIFSRSEQDGVPFIVYLATGILFTTFFSQGTIASGSAIVSARNILEKVRVPAEIFSVSAALAAAANFVLSMIAILLIIVVSGTGLTPLLLLAPIPVLLMLMFVAGAGLLVASVAVVFYDVFDLVRVLAQIVTYASATFYPIDIVPPRLRWVLEFNPIFHHLEVFRAFTYGHELSPISLIVAISTSVFMLALGVWVFSRSWKNVVVTL